MKERNLALIVMDTMRLDEFNRLEQRRKLFSSLGYVAFVDSCIAPSPWTLPSHASIFTGLYPSEHGAHETKRIKALDIDRIRLKMPTFVSELNALGYNTYAISANPYVTPIYGFSGFSRFYEESYFTDIFGSVVEVSDRLKPLVAKYRNLYGTNLLKISLAVLNKEPDLFLELLASASLRTPIAALKKIKAKVFEGWPIEKGGFRIVKKIKQESLKEPYFLFVNLMEAHEPYVEKKGMDLNWATPFLKKGPDQKVITLWKRLYAKAASKAYVYAAEIAKTLLKTSDNETMVIVTSDHGQAFGEHGFVGHGTVLYDEVVRVPLALLSNEKLHKTGSGYCSLVNLKEFVMAYAAGEEPTPKLYSKAVYAQSFGVPANIPITPAIDVKKLRKFDRKSVRKFA
ncbi:MAG: sulfatase-like hydrolase/transferase [Candidatus Micrarchaeia archaeon]